MAMMARRPLERSWQKTTCSWPASLRWSVRSKTPMGLRSGGVAGPCGAAPEGRGRCAPRSQTIECDDAAVTAYAAHLRVYEPLAAFEGAERRRWEAYLRAGNVPSVAGGTEMEHVAGVRALIGRPPTVIPVLGEHAFV